MKEATVTMIIVMADGSYTLIQPAVDFQYIVIVYVDLEGVGDTCLVLGGNT